MFARMEEQQQQPVDGVGADEAEFPGTTSPPGAALGAGEAAAEEVEISGGVLHCRQLSDHLTPIALERRW